MDVNVWVLPRGLGGLGHKVCVLPCGSGGPGHQVWVLLCGLGVHWTYKVREDGRSRVLATVFGLWGVGG
jgi:hypothetical protein